ncbi:MAG TPA: hypothetical protein VLX59_01130, partial [Acidimicrobiales bacterium]|nr:hypothetical protein [Acidimicrobiales bacterium]
EVAAAYPGTSSSFAPSVQLFATNSSGSLTAESQLPESCPTDVRFGPNASTLYSAACSGGALTAYTIASNQLASIGSVPGATSQTLAVGPDGSVYLEAPSGLEQAQVSGGTFTMGSATAYPPAQTITSMTVAPDGSQLFVGSFSTSTINDYAIGAGGQLTLANQIPIMAGLPTVLAVTGSCPGIGSTCTETQNFQVTIAPGTLTLTTPYTTTNPFVLPALALSSDGTYLSSSASFPASGNPASQQIVVTSTLAGDPGWTVSVSATSLTDGTATIAASGFGLTNGALIGGTCAGAPATCSASSTFPGTITFANLPAHNPSPVDTDSNSGLTSTPQAWCTTPAGAGTAVMSGTLTLLAPTTTPAGTYSGTITFSAI